MIVKKQKVMDVRELPDRPTQQTMRYIHMTQWAVLAWIQSAVPWLVEYHHPPITHLHNVRLGVQQIDDRVEVLRAGARTEHLLDLVLRYD